MPRPKGYWLVVCKPRSRSSRTSQVDALTFDSPSAMLNKLSSIGVRQSNTLRRMGQRLRVLKPAIIVVDSSSMNRVVVDSFAKAVSVMAAVPKPRLGMTDQYHFAGLILLSHQVDPRVKVYLRLTWFAISLALQVGLQFVVV